MKLPASRSTLNPDAAAILIALTLATLVRLNVLPFIRW